MANFFPKFFCLIVPLVFMGFQLVAEFSLSNEALIAMHQEGGFHELAQFVVMAMAFVIAAFILLRMKGQPLWLYGWVGVAMLASLYVAGEEISWGQHIINWPTPEYWQRINDQGETNLHNTSSWFDQKPRLVLLIGSIVGGILIPLLLRYKPAVVPQKFAVIYPPGALGLTAALALGIKLSDKIMESFTDEPFFARGSEVEELCLFYFVLTYLVVLCRRVLQH